MSLLGAQGVLDRMAEIDRRLGALAPSSPRPSEDFASHYNAAASDGPLVPTVLGGSPIMGPIGGGTSSDLRTMAQSAAERHGVDPDLFQALVTQESSWNPQATSPAGAKGLCQLMDGTARDMGVANPYDPAESLNGGARYLRRMLDVNHGDVRRALASYNAGPGFVMSRSPGEWPHETRNYVSRILSKVGGGV